MTTSFSQLVPALALLAVAVAACSNGTKSPGRVDAGLGGATGGTSAGGSGAGLPAGADANGNAVANVEYRVSRAGQYARGLFLTRVAATSFVDSLFWLTPATRYDGRVPYADPDDAPLDTAWAGATASTRDEISIPSINDDYAGQAPDIGAVETR